VRTLLALMQYDALDDPRLIQDIDTSGITTCPEEDCQERAVKIRDLSGLELKNMDLAPEAAKERDEDTFENIQLVPGNIYEDMGRDKTIVIMVFVMQVFFIALVCYDTYGNTTSNCFDGTSGCPIVETAGSYALYVIGIFLASVYMLGPRTDYGRSEQDPEFWLLLLLAAKGKGFKILWDNPMECPVHSNKGYSTLKDSDGKVIKEEDGVTDKLFHCHYLNQNDTRMWRRFLMSFICNGVGFHILVHALPIQVAMQSSFMGAVYRSVGMMYLVDLDDTKGFPLTIARDDGESTEQDAGVSNNDTGITKNLSHEEDGMLDIDLMMSKGPKNNVDVEELNSQVQEVIDKAHADIDNLHQFGPKNKDKADKTPGKKHREINSDSVIMSVIGYGITGLGGSGKSKIV